MEVKNHILYMKTLYNEKDVYILLRKHYTKAMF